MPELLTMGQAAQRLHCQVWHIRRLYERGILPEPPRFGRYRTVRSADLAEIERLLCEHGYLPAGE